MKCIKCKNKMVLDDTDFNFEGNYDDYYLCYNCGMYCIEEIRFNKRHKIKWSEDND